MSCTCDLPRFVNPTCPRHGAHEYHGAPVCNGKRYSVSPYDRSEGTDVHHEEWTCPVHGRTERKL